MTQEADGTQEGTQEGQGAEGAADEGQSVFERLRQKVDAGERVFPVGGEQPQDEEMVAAAADEGAEELEEEPQVGQEDEEGVQEDEGAEEPPEDLEEAPEGEEEGDEPAGEADDDLVVALPGRNAGEEFEIEASDQETKEALNRLRKGYMRREALNAAMESVDADRQEIEEIDTALAVDPAGFLLERVDRGKRVQVARALLFDDEVWEELQEEILEAEDPERREVRRLKSEAERREAADASRTEIQKARATRKAVSAISQNIEDMVPAGMDPDRARRFQLAALSAAEDLTMRVRRLDISREELVGELSREGLLDRFGIDPKARPASKGDGAGTRRGSGSSSTSASKNGQGSGDGDGDAQTAAGLKKARRRRKAVAGSASAGAGAPTATVELSKSTSVKDRIKEVRNKGLGNVLAGKT